MHETSVAGARDAASAGSVSLLRRRPRRRGRF